MELGKIEIFGFPICIVPFGILRLRKLKAMPLSTSKTGLNCVAASLYVAGLIDAETCLYYSDLLARALNQYQIKSDQMTDDEIECSKTAMSYLVSKGIEKLSTVSILEYVSINIKNSKRVFESTLIIRTIEDIQVLNEIIESLDVDTAIPMSFGGEKCGHAILLWKESNGYMSIIDPQRGRKYAGNTMNQLYDMWKQGWANGYLTQTDTYLQIRTNTIETIITYFIEQGKAWEFYTTEGIHELRIGFYTVKPYQKIKPIKIRQFDINNVTIQQHTQEFYNEIKKADITMKDINEEDIPKTLSDALQLSPFVKLYSNTQQRILKSR